MSDRRSVAVVTGGVRGVGAAYARALARSGHDLVLGYYGDDGAADGIATELGAMGAATLLVKFDVRRRPEVVRLFDEAEGKFDTIDVVCANAGVENVQMSFADLDEGEMDRIVDTDIKGTLFTLSEAARRVRDGGRIIATASTIALYPPANGGVYASSKAAVRVMVEVLAQELGSRNVTVNSIDPGAVAHAGIFSDIDEKQRATFTELTPLGRMIEPSDLEGVAAFLVSGAAAMITGQHLAVNGGARA